MKNILNSIKEKTSSPMGYMHEDEIFSDSQIEESLKPKSSKKKLVSLHGLYTKKAVQKRQKELQEAFEEEEAINKILENLNITREEYDERMSSIEEESYEDDELDEEEPQTSRKVKPIQFTSITTNYGLLTNAKLKRIQPEQKDNEIKHKHR